MRMMSTIYVPVNVDIVETLRTGNAAFDFSDLFFIQLTELLNP